MAENPFKGFGLLWSKNELIKRVRNTLSEQLSKDHFTAGGFIFTLDIPEDQPFSLDGVDKTIRVKLPMDISFSKPEGLFTIEGNAGILLDLDCTFVLDEEGDLSILVGLLSHDWYKTPAVTMGNIDFPFEFLADLVVRHVKDKYLEIWVNTFNEKWDISDILSKIQHQYARNILLSSRPDWYFNLEIKQWVFIGFDDAGDDLKIILYLDFEAKISDNLSAFLPPTLKCVESPVAGLITQENYDIRFQCSFEGLERIITFFLNHNELGGKSFDVEKMIIRNTSFFEIKAILRSPLQGTVTLAGTPFFDHQKKTLDLANVKVDVTANQFFYQLTSPIIEKIIRNRIEEFLPFPLQTYLQQAIQNGTKSLADKSIDLHIKNSKLTSFTLDNSQVRAVLSMEGFTCTSEDEKWSIFSL